jgi:hypothetical protein
VLWGVAAGARTVKDHLTSGRVGILSHVRNVRLVRVGWSSIHRDDARTGRVCEM